MSCRDRKIFFGISESLRSVVVEVVHSRCAFQTVVIEVSRALEPIDRQVTGRSLHRIVGVKSSISLKASAVFNRLT